jgi:hypothetical protein
VKQRAQICPTSLMADQQRQRRWQAAGARPYARSSGKANHSRHWRFYDQASFSAKNATKK